MKCYGHEARKKIVDKYDDVVPVLKLKLLPGQEIQGDAGKKITDEYYVFDVMKNGKSIDSIVCSPTTARDFLNLTGHKSLSTFNPFRGINRRQGLGNGNGNVTNNISTTLSPTEKQLSNAIHWIFMLFGGRPTEGELLSIYTKMLNRDIKTMTGVNGVNTIIYRSFNGESLTDVIKSKKLNNLSKRAINFSLIKGMYNKMKYRTEPYSF